MDKTNPSIVVTVSKQIAYVREVSYVCEDIYVYCICI